MILSTTNATLGSVFGRKESIGMILDAGFDAADLSLINLREKVSPFWDEGWQELVFSFREEVEKRGKFFNQAHAPFPSSRRDNPEYNEMIIPRLKRSIEIAGMIGAKCIVVHPLLDIPYAGNEKLLKERNIAFYRSLEPAAEKAGVIIALENMWQRRTDYTELLPAPCASAAEFADYLDTLNSPNFTACLDLGHCGLCGYDAAEAIRILGHERLGALHVHDNDYVNDSHTLPYTGAMHWDEICRALHDIDYRGDFTFEASSFYHQFPPALHPAALSFMEKVGRELISRIERA